MKREIMLKGIPIEYELQRKNVKNINLRIKPDLSVCVSANYRVPISAVEAFMKAKADFILSALEKFKSRGALNEEKTFPQKLYLFGRECAVQRIAADRNYITADIEKGEVLFFMKSPDDMAAAEKMADVFLKEHSEPVVIDLCRKIYPCFAANNIPFPEIRFRRMVSQWGNCRPTQKVLTFNTLLCCVPLRCIEYVVAHEFVHFLHPNHSAQFYAKLDIIFPRRRECEKELKKYGCVLRRNKR